MQQQCVLSAKWCQRAEHSTAQHVLSRGVDQERLHGSLPQAPSVSSDALLVLLLLLLLVLLHLHLLLCACLQVGSLTGQVGNTVGGTLSGLKANLDSATSGVSGALGQGLGQVTSTTKAATDAVTSAVSSGQAAVQQTFEAVNSQVAAVSGQVASSVDATTQQVLGALPPPVKDALVTVGGAAAVVGGQAVAHPREAAVVALAVGVPTAYRYGLGCAHTCSKHNTQPFQVCDCVAGCS